MSTDDDLTIAYMDGLHTGRKQEQDRILRIVHEQAHAYGKPGECMVIGIRAKVRNVEPKPDWSAA